MQEFLRSVLEQPEKPDSVSELSQSLSEFGPRNRFLTAPILNQLPKLRTCAEFDLFGVQPFNTGNQGNRFAHLHHEYALRACLFDALFQVRFAYFESLHRI